MEYLLDGLGGLDHGGNRRPCFCQLCGQHELPVTVPACSSAGFELSSHAAHGVAVSPLLVHVDGVSVAA